MRKVLFTLPSLQHGGAERVIVHLVNSLDRRRYAPALGLGVVEGPYLADVRDDVSIHALGARKARAAWRGILKTVWELRPDTVISTLGLNFAVAMARPFFPPGTRVVVREGSSASAYLKHIRSVNGARAGLYRLLHRWLYRLPDLVVCQSDFMLQDLAVNHHLPASKLVRIYNPVDVEKIRTLADAVTIEYPGAGPHLLTVGHLYPPKGYDVLLHAFQRVLREYPTATLTFVGDGVSRPELEQLTDRLALRQSVRFVGFHANPYAFLKGADLFVSSSLYEGFANVIIEAMACGKPVVATDCPGGNREVVREGENGWLARAGDAESLAAVLCRGLAARHGIRPEQLREYVEERFSIRRIATLYEEVL